MINVDLEYFNGCEWKPLKDYVEGDRVLQCNAENSEGLFSMSELVKPLEVRFFTDKCRIATISDKDMVISLPNNTEIVVIDDDGIGSISIDDMVMSHCGIEGYDILDAIEVEDYLGVIRLGEDGVMKLVGALIGNIDINSEYLKVVDGKVMLSEKIYSLSYSDRLLLLDTLWDSDDDTDEPSRMLYNIKSLEEFKVFKTLCLMTYSFGVSYVKVNENYRPLSNFIGYEFNCYSGYCLEDKVCDLVDITVPSGYLVVRDSSTGALFVVKCNRG